MKNVVVRACSKPHLEFGRIPGARERLLQSHTYRKATVFGRIFGAKRQKPGFPLQVLGFAHANPVGFPLQSRMHGRAAKLRMQFRDQPLARAQRQRKIASQFCHQSLAPHGLFRFWNKFK
jgi:hypothetical protein